EPGDPEKRMAASRTLTLAVDDAMTKVTGPADEMNGGSDDNRLCWIRIRDCGAAPYWIDARPDREGHPRAWQVADPTSDVPDAVRDAFDQAVVAAAARFVAKEPAPALADLAVSKGDAILPDDLDDTILVGLDAERGDVQSYVTVPLSLSAAIAGG